MVLLEEPGPALGAVHSQVEEARALAEAGRYSEARLRFDSVLAHVRKATAGMEDTVLRGRWQECARRLGEELALVVACEEESAALGRAASSCGSRRVSALRHALSLEEYYLLQVGVCHAHKGLALLAGDHYGTSGDGPSAAARRAGLRFRPADQQAHGAGATGAAAAGRIRP